MKSCLAFFFRRRRPKPNSPTTQPPPPAPSTPPPPQQQQQPFPRSIDTQSIDSSHNRNTSNTLEESGAMSGRSINIISNHDFSDGLAHWHPNSCHAYVASEASGLLSGIRANSGGAYAVVTERSQIWQGLEQDITAKIAVGIEYMLSAYVGVHGNLHGPAGVRATLKLENADSSTEYRFIQSVSVSDNCWKKLEGSFSIEIMPRRAVFYIEGPDPGVDILVDSLTVSHESIIHPANILSNHNFIDGLASWHPNNCHASVVSHKPGFFPGVEVMSGQYYALVNQRTERWQGLEQDITGKVSSGKKYRVSAYVGVNCNHSWPETVQATLKLENLDASINYVPIGSAQVYKEQWVKLEGSFSLASVRRRVDFYLEGPNPGVDLLIDSVTISCEETSLRSGSHDHQEAIIKNPYFEDGLNNWTGRGCKICLLNSVNGEIHPVSGMHFSSATERRETWHGIEQDITRKVNRKIAYEVAAMVRIHGNADSATMRSTIWVQEKNGQEYYIGISKHQVSREKWVEMKGKFIINGHPSKVVLYLEGPPPGTDILVDSFVVKLASKGPPSTKPDILNAKHEGNIIKNSSFKEGLNFWTALGSCHLSLPTDSLDLPPLKTHPRQLSNHFLLTSNRTETWMGPSQIITDQIKLHQTYEVTALVGVGLGACGLQNISVALGVDNQWINGGQVEVDAFRWYELKGSFRIEKKPSKVIVYLQGPLPGVDMMLKSLEIFPVNMKARLVHLKEKTEKVRKRDIILNFSLPDGENLVGASLKIEQTQNSFALGSCINRSNIDNEEFVDFFLKNFNWAVFCNELKWYHTEPQRGTLSYKDADQMIDFCVKHDLQMRGHCIFWEVDDAVQPWVQSLNNNDLLIAVQSRLRDLLTRYRGMFKHYDVNNEMLHGSFFQDRLGKDIRSYMFREAHQLDPSALLFVNDYHVEDGCDIKSTPERYLQHILDLQEQGAPVGGIGIQGHITHPVGEIICDALDKLAVLGLPIWFTEVDVSAINEHVRADDLEVVLREAFAHPAVEGVVLWGFWELSCRDDSYLVDAEGNVNEAGKRLIALKQEWLTNADGHIGSNGEFKFRGYHGTYNVEITTAKAKILRSFVVDKGDAPLLVTLS